MAYITTTDYESSLKAANLTAMLSDSQTALTTAETEAISMVRTYLVDLYDVNSIFAQTGDNRHPHLVRICKIIVLYILHQRLPKRIAPEQVSQDYADAITFLEKVSDGKIGLELPRKLDSAGKNKTRFTWGSNPGRSY